ncbi:hypothetical protein DFH29DRAFT_1031052 [Suillus ampliporus]|nr:hypothetical protein DFH29DRAFT_1031794 [Suillus ampliporus]KAG0695292.1 hypothetical protein DFH29DRAFT_1031052 [Suillus ampliporus]
MLAGTFYSPVGWLGHLKMSVTDTFSLQLAKYTNVAALAILIYDYFITLHSEVRKVSRPISALIVLVFSRYVPFAGSFMTSYSAVKIGAHKM